MSPRQVGLLIIALAACNNPANSDDEVVSDTSDFGDTDSGDDVTTTDDGDGDGDGDTAGMFVSSPDLSAHLTLSGDFVFVVEALRPPRIVRVAKADASAQIYHQVESIFNTPIGAFMASDTWLFATTDYELLRGPVDGEGMESLINVANGEELAVNTSNVFLRTTNNLYRFDLDGSGDVLLGGSLHRNIQLSGGRLFSIVYGELVEVDTESGAISELQVTAEDYCLDNQNILIEGESGLQRLSIDGGSLTSLVSGADLGGEVLDLACDGEHLYWLAEAPLGGGATLRRVPTSGGSVDVLFTHDSGLTPSLLRLDSTHAYWFVENTPNPSVWRASK